LLYMMIQEYPSPQGCSRAPFPFTFSIPWWNPSSPVVDFFRGCVPCGMSTDP
jgi:hypothetical protein